jgi:hypothetical protein
MGAALTYARRYALFTMVGIAGEDDLDAPDIANDEAMRGKTGEAGPTPDSSLEPMPARSSQSRSRIAPPVKAKLNAEASAAARAQLIQEIQTLPEGELQPRAISILKAKNRLSADDAKRVEEAFAARMALQDASPKAPAMEEPASTLIDPTKPPEDVKRPRRRPRKTSNSINHSAAHPVTSPATVEDGQSESLHQKTDVAPTKIDKSKLTFGEPRGLRDKAHLKLVASQPCLICGRSRSPADAHHLRFTQPRAMGLKVSDEFGTPLQSSSS